MASTQLADARMQRKFVREEELKASGARRSGTLRVEIEVQEYDPYEACTRLEVTISQKVGRDKGYTEIGYMVAFLVDKTTAAKTKKSKSALWVQELLQQDDELDRDQTHQLREISRALFNKSGAIKAKLHAWSEELSSERFVFVDVFQLYDAYRRKGAGRQPMRMFLQLLPQVLGTEGGDEEAATPCILSPGPSADVKIKNGKSTVEIEAALIKPYETNGFGVWLQGNPEVEDSLTVMGRLV